ncbi:MAG: biotin transporter BioY [Sedimentisphaerales bacterium]|nr:biotin transporter BioY [Sedimentisphaerales bacterium]
MQASNTIAGVFRPNDKAFGILYDVLMVVFGSLIVALSARIMFYLPFSPVPVTAQTFTVLVLGILLGSKRGAITMTAYLAEGYLGLPVFAGGVGPAVLIGPTGGYLVGFVAAAFLTGRLAESGWDRRFITTVAAMLIGDVILLTFGFVWLAILTNVKTAFIAGLIVFIPGDILKVALAGALLPTGWKMLERLNMKT